LPQGTATEESEKPPQKPQKPPQKTKGLRTNRKK
jgi:hypothetical protein